MLFAFVLVVATVTARAQDKIIFNDTDFSIKVTIKDTQITRESVTIAAKETKTIGYANQLVTLTIAPDDASSGKLVNQSMSTVPDGSGMANASGLSDRINGGKEKVFSADQRPMLNQIEKWRISIDQDGFYAINKDQ